MTLKTQLAVVVALSTVACSGGGGGADAGGHSYGGSTDGGGGVDGGAQSIPGGPRILTFGTNSTTIDETKSLIVTVVLTDPDGVDDIVGGTLTDMDSGGTYGPFATSAQEGAYGITLTWAAMGAVSRIDAPPAGAPRHLHAEFFDQAGHKASQDFTITLKCHDEGAAAVDGVCSPPYMVLCTPGVPFCAVTTSVAGAGTGNQLCADTAFPCLSCEIDNDPNLGCTAQLPANATCRCMDAPPPP